MKTFKAISWQPGYPNTPLPSPPAPAQLQDIHIFKNE